MKTKLICLSFPNLNIVDQLFQEYSDFIELLKSKMDFFIIHSGNIISMSAPEEQIDKIKFVIETLYEKLENDSVSEGEDLNKLLAIFDNFR